MILALTVSILIGFIAMVGVYQYWSPRLPDPHALKETSFQVPLKVFSQDQKLIAIFGEKKRVPLTLEQIPEKLVQAVLASEDSNFYSHSGVDLKGLARAVINLIRTGKKGQGGSTITMQVARNFFLDREKTYIRKLKEIVLSYNIESVLSKEEILELYLNKVFLGHRSYGVGAAAQVYYGKPITELSLPQMAMIAGLTQSPSIENPITNQYRAEERRNYVLKEMLKDDYIDEIDYEVAIKTPLTAKTNNTQIELEAPYVAELVRAEIESRYGEQAYTSGLEVTTTIQSDLQIAANKAIRKALYLYEERHGYRGHIENVGAIPNNMDEQIELIKTTRNVADLVVGLVLNVKRDEAVVRLADESEVLLMLEDLKWAGKYIDEDKKGRPPTKVGDILTRGDKIWLRQEEGKWLLAQLPKVEGALVSVDPKDGRIISLVGGYDFRLSKFNRATQAKRQPGSSFKPFVYSAALEYGFNPSSIINDAPVVVRDEATDDFWRPENYSGKFFGPTPLRRALAKSRNLVSIRLLRTMGLDYAIDHVKRFGFKKVPKLLSVALGTGEVSPIELAQAYSVLANGGFRIEPNFLLNIRDEHGEILFEYKSQEVCEKCSFVDNWVDYESKVSELQKRKLEDQQLGVTTASMQSKELQQQDNSESELLKNKNPEETLDEDGLEKLSVESPEIKNPYATRVISERNSWMMRNLLKDVIRYGTGTSARKLGRVDIAGKTGTTNDQRDAWFAGFNERNVTVTWIGFDNYRLLGKRETGGKAALPAWVEFMGAALNGRKEIVSEPPKTIKKVRIDPSTGKLPAHSEIETRVEYFYAERTPTQSTTRNYPALNNNGEENSENENQYLNVF